ncbi:MAG: hypothetical protein KatS3mg102_0652 [Planctomycetota bacterium]|nr:MAG: hypothetical protein KatS3mg102_0652 [Planctomycetota bacterium]
MLRKVGQAELTALARRVVQALADLEPQAIWLFGSYARGEVDEWSDLDLAVVLPTELPFSERGRLVRSRLGGLGLAVECLVYTPEEFARLAREPRGVLHSILTEGVRLDAIAAAR